MALQDTEKSSLREHGWHVDVSSAQVEHAKCVVEALFRKTALFYVGKITYSEAPKDWRFQNNKCRVFCHNGAEVACFDMWGNLVIYNEVLNR
jgi:hypothetical protein